MTSFFVSCRDVPQAGWASFCSFVAFLVCRCPGKYSIDVQRRIDSVGVTVLTVLLVILILVTYN